MFLTQISSRGALPGNAVSEHRDLQAGRFSLERTIERARQRQQTAPVIDDSAGTIRWTGMDSSSRIEQPPRHGSDLIEALDRPVSFDAVDHSSVSQEP